MTTQPRWRRVRRLAAFAAGVMLALYVAGYALLYRRGAAEAERYGYPDLLYVPAEDALDAWGEEPTQHTVCGWVYGPLNVAHHRLLGGRAAFAFAGCGTRP